jgi:DNA transposition AAA+ family ATPase
MKRKPIKLTEQVRQAIETCGKTRYQISKDTGIDQATLCRFMGGKGGLSNPILDTLGEYLRLRIVADKPENKGRTKGR